MDRLKLIQELLCANSQTAAMTMRYLGKARKYSENDDLYMSEVHFVVEVGAMVTPTMGELAQRLNVTQGAVTQTAARLEKKGYIFRMKDDFDKRMTRIGLTEQGMLLREAHISYDHAAYSSISEDLKEFSDEDLELFLRYEKIMEEVFRKRI